VNVPHSDFFVEAAGDYFFLCLVVDHARDLCVLAPGVVCVHGSVLVPALTAASRLCEGPLLGLRYLRHVGCNVDDAQLVVVGCEHELTFFRKLNRADASVGSHGDLFDKLHLARVPEVDQAIVASACENARVVLLQTRHSAEVRVLQEPLVLLNSDVPKPNGVVVAARQESVFRHGTNLLHSCLRLLVCAQGRVLFLIESRQRVHSDEPIGAPCEEKVV